MTFHFNACMVALLLAGCDMKPPPLEFCVEWDRITLHRGVPVTCRMIACHSGGEGISYSGVATLWCDAPTDAGVR